MGKLTVCAKSDQLDTVLNFIENGLLNLCAKKTNALILAAEEVFVNIVKYAYDGEDGEVTVSMSSEDTRTLIRFSDRGKPFNPLEEIEPPDVSASVKTKKMGGLGMYMVKNIADDVTYEYSEGQNILTIIDLS
ncbi:hypothetical protein AGMMS49975_30050 [Clostridia bacterium]|nr:hypothetical protein AGMMS49975_30050 [Clostridia bacterium]